LVILIEVLGHIFDYAQNLDELTQICYTNGVKIELGLDQFLLKFFANLRANLLEILK
jgi:hypothetical protein